MSFQSGTAVLLNLIQSVFLKNRKKAFEYFLYWQMSSDLNAIADAFLEYLLLLEVMSVISLTKLITIILILIDSGNFKALNIKHEFFHLFQILVFFFCLLVKW